MDKKIPHRYARWYGPQGTYLLLRPKSSMAYTKAAAHLSEE